MNRESNIETIHPAPLRWSSYRWPLAFALIAILVGGGLWRYYASSKNAPGSTAGAHPVGRGPATPVAYEEVHAGDFPVILTGLGTVTPSATSVVKSQISGQLVEVNFVEGQAVKAGDILAKVDSRTYELTLKQNEGQLRRDLATLHNAQRDLERYRTLRSKVQDAVSAQQVDSQEALIAQTRATVEIDQAMVDTARLNLGYCNIVSLIDGRTGLRQVDQGNFVTPNDPNGIVVVTRLKPITVIFTLPESRLQPVLRRFRSGAKLPVAAFDNASSTKLALGELKAIDNQIDPATGTVKLRAEFANEDERLFPSQFVNVELYVEMLHDAVTAPLAAMQRGPEGSLVYLIKPDNTVASRPVKLGASAHDRVIVETGLQSGDRVVTEGATRLRDGASVTLPAAAARPGGPPGR
ncbi:efflux RND transporter periplasmic adaptor subunit [Methylocystis bryophila]|uniref:Multidrug transporter subunit MdtA n=1 Tax=Methylocystis bryophila TaxID=655015 RepID=A0A1W6MTC3_9HYPH|nr:efflux RND transporter periplasmic adaptor subunit [Methylocystis bryophila]ARN80776.1 multidrug transporter subunit MdtA [Methylocystis bryophila]BDV40857.1 multidrug transporter [Methylocystis bryophila]